MEVSLSHYMSSWHFQKSLKQSRVWHNKLVKGDRTRFYIFLMFLILGFELLPALFAGISETNFHKDLIMWINETFTAWKKRKRKERSVNWRALTAMSSVGFNVCGHQKSLTWKSLITASGAGGLIRQITSTSLVTSVALLKSLASFQTLFWCNICRCHSGKRMYEMSEMSEKETQRST